MKKKISIVVGIIIIAAIIGVVVYVVNMTSDIKDTANAFFDAIKKNDFEKAYEYTSSEFKANTSLKQLETFFRQTSLINYNEAVWSKRTLENNAGELGGVIRAIDGGEIPVTLKFIKEDGKWKILSLRKEGYGFSSAEVVKGMPTNDELFTMASQSIYELGKAINTKNFSDFYSKISLLWQSQTTKEKLYSVFKTFADNKIDLTVVKDLKPTFIEKPRFVDEKSILIRGFYNVNEKRYFFDLLYIYENKNWKLLGAGINVQ
ncbi:MAG: DUF4864 domain-containing protein [Candidatus Kapabacteria bacterium]|nr:DUF4864 domain-containing protein [Candidatus Kapabacteria bacterium]